MIRHRVLAFSLVLGAMAAVAPLSLTLDRLAPPIEDAAGAAPILPRAGVVRPLLLGFHPLAADLYWLRTIQYFGAHAQTDRQFPHLYPLVDLVTSLDPHFVEAYQIGGLLLSIGRQFPEAIAIYEKGISNNPDRWELPHDLGRLYFLDLRDEALALHWWEHTDRLAGRPSYIPRFLARLNAKTGSLETAFELWKALYERSDNEWVTKTAMREMQRILAQMRSRTRPKADQ